MRQLERGHIIVDLLAHDDSLHQGVQAIHRPIAHHVVDQEGEDALIGMTGVVAALRESSQIARLCSRR